MRVFSSAVALVTHIKITPTTVRTPHNGLQADVACFIGFFPFFHICRTQHMKVGANASAITFASNTRVVVAVSACPSHCWYFIALDLTLVTPKVAEKGFRWQHVAEGVIFGAHFRYHLVPKQILYHFTQLDNLLLLLRLSALQLAQRGQYWCHSIVLRVRVHIWIINNNTHTNVRHPQLLWGNGRLRCLYSSAQIWLFISYYIREW